MISTSTTLVLAGEAGRTTRHDSDLRSLSVRIKFDLTFPSCWDGTNLYKNDQSHMAYPTNSVR